MPCAEVQARDCLDHPRVTDIRSGPLADVGRPGAARRSARRRSAWRPATTWRSRQSRTSARSPLLQRRSREMKTARSPFVTCGIVSLALVVSLVSTGAAQTPATDKDAPFAYAAPAFIKELDTKYPAQPPVPPSPPRYGGVLHFPAVVRAFD